MKNKETIKFMKETKNDIQNLTEKISLLMNTLLKNIDEENSSTVDKFGNTITTKEGMVYTNGVIMGVAGSVNNNENR